MLKLHATQIQLCGMLRLSQYGNAVCECCHRNQLARLQQSINQSWIYIARKRKASNALMLYLVLYGAICIVNEI